MAAGKESLDDLETRVTGQCCCRGTRLLSGGECFGVEERRLVGEGEAGQLRMTRECVGGCVVDSRHMANILSEFQKHMTDVTAVGRTREQKLVLRRGREACGP